MPGLPTTAALAAHSDRDLLHLVQAATPDGTGVGGGTATADVDGVPVFLKRIPITDRELAAPRHTTNLFDLPVRHQYGMYRLPVPAFNAWRELAANQIVTEGILAGEPALFPLLYHWRVLPGRPPVAPEHRDIDAVVDQFGGDRAIRARLEALAGATASLVLFLQHLPADASALLADPSANAAIIARHSPAAERMNRFHHRLYDGDLDATYSPLE
ncbi:hypothetical protein [Actinoplanes couchii]|uniref:Uncharacterized protein n=1 Tax=Actinoplanes couchii TaxID=403638 RepID=A0ABQ3XGL8_9ACTN|nr:hypothetical protein [Actinoplanes couchii]MDR6321106.1 hypothetical protein [Actinoplanes couchii]GID57619.1 hypothetical protein Aco03nite_060230 [Actinoplanes couchii]